MEKDQINKLIQKCLTNGAESDWQILRAELSKAENVEFREEFEKLSKLTSRDRVADGEKMWQVIAACQSAGHNRRSFGRQLLRYAAVLALPVLLGGILLWVHRQKDVLAPSGLAVVQLEPGRPQAYLLLDGGERVDLSVMGRDTVLHRMGVEICLDSLKTVAYQSKGDGNTGVVYNTIVVPRAGEYRLALADGTIVWLNSASELKFPVAFNGQSNRKVYLRGEAYFDVAEDKNHPFVVEAGDTEVEVLGTQFNINAYDADQVIQTTLVEGRVRMADCRHISSVVLSPDQQGIWENGRLTVKEVDVSAYTAWMQGKFYFESAPLAEIAAQLERWYDIDFFFNREELKQYEFTGVIRRDYPANRILEIIEKTTNVRFDIKGHTVTVR